MKASLFVSTYEMPRHLELVCEGLKRQSARGFEVFFCDDGSGSETGRVIKEFKNQTKILTHHIWQEHQGFRKCRILNQALKKASGQICIFLDGDCIPHKDYVSDHIAFQQEGYYLAGRRVELGQGISSEIQPGMIQSGFFDWPHLRLILSALQGDTEFLNRSIRLPWQKIRELLKMDRIVDLKGCNYSVPRKALEAIHGFDEIYEGYGREDTDVEIRLQNLGLKIKSLKGVALQFHVWHPRREFTPVNEDLLEDVKRSHRIQAIKGVSF